MRFFSIITLTVFLGFNSFAQGKKAEIPGCVPILGDFLFIRATEVSNFDYMEFLFYVKKNNPDTSYYNALLPDTNAWKDELSYNEPYVEYYFRHPAYRDYPVVNISHWQAEEFCNWLEERLNYYLPLGTKTDVQKVKVRLPDEEEWEFAARGGDPYAVYPWKGHSVRYDGPKKANLGDMRANFVRGKGDYMGVAGSLNDAADVTAPTHSYWPNAFGIYNMAGNVAEMLDEPGRTKGGSWRSRGYDIRIDAPDKHAGWTDPSPEIGFRYIVEVVAWKQEKENETNLNAKIIEKQLAGVITDTLYASKYEVSNAEYNKFLSESNDENLFPNSNLWSKTLKYGRYYKEVYFKDEQYREHPVVNVTKEQAKAYCDWLTDKYNNDPKRKFNKVIFRLPTEKEWEMAAYGGLSGLSPYPWGGPYLRNNQGTILGNFRPIEESFLSFTSEKGEEYLLPTDYYNMRVTDFDGGYITTEVESYHPNGLGLYNMAGNVAEMISDNDFTKGGGWLSHQDNVKITAREKYKGAHPNIGFRVFMEVIEK